ncbi:hypothetical protein ACA910_001332 [Epithemia clementina (nom. ined.)]
MGLSLSRSNGRNAVNTHETAGLSISPGVFGFVSLLIGTAQLPLPIISCADALMDLTAEAEALWSLAYPGVSGLSNIGSVKFLPFVLSSRVRDLELMSSMTFLERILFCSDAIRILLQGENVGWKILSVWDVNELNKLNARIVELSALKKHESTVHGRFEECGICLDDEPDCILPCGHQLCDRCERLWVRRKLNCPFCRAQMGAKELNSEGWEIAKYDAEAVTKDIEHLTSRINSFWGTEMLEGELNDILKPYDEISRKLDPFSEERDGFVFL